MSRMPALLLAEIARGLRARGAAVPRTIARDLGDLEVPRFHETDAYNLPSIFERGFVVPDEAVANHAGFGDFGTPRGVHTKGSEDFIGGIAERAPANVSLKVRPGRVLHAADRDALEIWGRTLSDEYEHNVDAFRYIDQDFRNFRGDWDEREQELGRLALKARRALTEALRNEGYSSVRLGRDEGVGGEVKNSLIVIEPGRVRSALTGKLLYSVPLLGALRALLGEREAA